jgi:hypothetical protein
MGFISIDGLIAKLPETISSTPEAKRKRTSQLHLANCHRAKPPASSQSKRRPKIGPNQAAATTAASRFEMSHRKLIGCCLLVVAASAISFHSSQLAAASKQEATTNNPISLVQKPQATTTTVASNSSLNNSSATNVTAATNSTEPVSERLVKESSLHAEESRTPGVFVKPPPSDVDQPESSRRASLKPATFVSGGSGNSYMSMTHDGSNRYDFGFDTSGQQQRPAGQQASANTTPAGAAAGQQRQPAATADRRSPRLMREESRLEDGTVIGRYGYTDPFNVFRIVQYVAGPDGYFASEDVGALEASDGQPGDPSGRPRFQLNKQLHKALEQARALRLARSSSSTTAAAHSLVNSTRTTSAERSWWSGANASGGLARATTSGQAASSADLSRRLGAAAGGDDDEDTLNGSSSIHHSVRFATRINHVVGSNGVTYATAFRPTMATSLPTSGNLALAADERLAAAGGDSTRGTQQASSVRPVYVSTYYEDQTRASPSDRLRSRLPAPIYAPPAGESQPPEVDNTDDLAPSQPHHFDNQPVGLVEQHQQQQQQQPSSVLQSHPAWSLLNNNYNGNYQTALFIDHSAPPSGQYSPQPRPEPVAVVVGQTFAANFRREASMLDKLARRRSEHAPYSNGAGLHHAPLPSLAGQLVGPPAEAAPQELASAPQAQQSVAQAPTVGNPFVRFGTRMSFSPAVSPDVPSSSSHVRPVQTAQEPNYNYGFALKHFDAPLYHPEVHETNTEVFANDRQRATELTPVASVPAPPPQSFQFASTIVHSEVAAEQDYRPERMGGHSAADSSLSAPGFDEFQRSGSELRPTLEAASERVVAGGGSGNNATDRAGRRSSNTPSQPPPPQPAAAAHEPFAGERLVAYATRLRALPRASPAGWSTDDELSMEDSESVGYLPNGTHHAQHSRARLPDRTKKLSSIFKARTIQAGLSGAADETAAGAGSGSARLRRPMPANAKRQNSASSSRVAVTSSTSPLPTTPASTSTPSPTTTTAATTTTTVVQSTAQTRTEANDTRSAFADLPQEAAGAEAVQQAVRPSASQTDAVKPNQAGEVSSFTETLASGLPPASTTSGAQPMEPTNTTQPAAADAAAAAAGRDELPISDENVQRRRAPKEWPATGVSLVSGPGSAIVAGATRAEEDLSREAPQSASRAIIVDSGAGGMNSVKQLIVEGSPGQAIMEKILSIQKEMASKSAAAAVPVVVAVADNNSAAPATTNSSETNYLAPTTSTTSKSVESDDEITVGNNNRASTTAAETTPTTTSIRTTSTTTTTTSTTASPTLAQATGPLTATGVSESAEPPAKQLNLITDNELATMAAATNNSAAAADPSQEGRNFLTGPLLKMDSGASSAQDEFMVGLARDLDMLPFDSTRAQVMSEPSVKLMATTHHQTQPKGSENRTSERPATVGEQTDAAKSSTQPSAAVSTDGANERPSVGSLGAPAGPGSRYTNSTDAETNNRLVYTPNAGAPSDGTNMSSPRPSVAGTVATAAPPTTERPSQRPRTTGLPRFGRLVIKRGDKVVARFNASDSIPDSMIPTGASGAGEIIMPDMPRLGMRRYKAKKQAQQAQARSWSIKQTTTTTTTTTTELPATTLGSSSTRVNNETSSTAAMNSTEAPRLAVNSPEAALNTSRQTAVGEPTGEPRPPVGRSLLRGARSSGLFEEHHQDDLLSDESSVSTTKLRRASDVAPQAASSPKAASVDTTAAAASQFGTRNWSARLRVGELIAEAAGRQSSATNRTKKYDSNEDLKKLVEKIERIERTRPASGESRVDKMAAARRGKPPNKERLVAGNESAVDVADLRRVAWPPSTGAGSLADGEQRRPTDQQTPAADGEPKEASNESTRQAKSSTSKAEAAPRQTTIAPGKVSETTTTTHRLVANKSDTLKGASSLSSSIAFTVQLSPAIEGQWNKMRPVNTSQLAAANQSAAGTPTTTTRGERASPLLTTLLTKMVSSSGNDTAKLSNIRIDSHGHIHVRNNQSITVHVDIEPPKLLVAAGSTSAATTNNGTMGTSGSATAAAAPKHVNAGNETQLSAATSEKPPLVGAGAHKRISSRDTAAVSQPERDGGDLRRLRPAAPGQPDQARARPSADSGNGGVSGRSAATPPSDMADKDGPLRPRTRKPRMLCIEVEGHESEMRRHRSDGPELGAKRDQTRGTQTNIAPDVW